MLISQLCHDRMLLCCVWLGMQNLMCIVGGSLANTDAILCILQDARLVACAPHPKTSYHALVAQSDGKILVLDIATGKVASQV